MDHDAHFTPGAVERSPATTIDQISDGARQLLLVARQRLADIDTAIQEGQFAEAFGRAQELIGKLQPLAQAETYVGCFASSFIVRANDVQEGMVLHSFGRVTNVNRREHPNPGGDAPCIHVTLTCEEADEPIEYQADTELLALRAD